MHPLRRLRESGKPTFAQVSELLAENIVFNSPILARPIQGRELIAPIFTQSSATRGSGTYTAEFKIDESTTFLRWVGTMDGHKFESLEIIVDNDQGLIVERTIALRPYPALNYSARPCTQRSRISCRPMFGTTHPPSSDENQYQSLMDAARGLAHCSVMQAHKVKSAMKHPLLSVVDDDESVRESLPDLLREFGFAARAFSSAQEFLSSDYLDETKCLILDVAMPGMSGLDLQQELKRLGKEIPIIFITGQKDEDIQQQAFRQGAVKFLSKPFSDSALLEAVNAALPAN